ncbi:hypothetical protein L798_05102 [Zootermopsis nevadensis]|uniref:Uncharacterized protein n=1 Tax=Zootermopsis nevadensis TaxID=136037 RepID=A0A067RJS8_ZOONE|nr:hypothetical protein L798_05102 [Zootermopsis nevadensis]
MPFLRISGILGIDHETGWMTDELFLQCLKPKKKEKNKIMDPLY